MLSNIALVVVVCCIIYAVWRSLARKEFFWAAMYAGVGILLAGIEITSFIITHHTISQQFEAETFTHSWECIGLSINLMIFAIALNVHLWANRKKKD